MPNAIIRVTALVAALVLAAACSASTDGITAADPTRTTDGGASTAEPTSPDEGTEPGAGFSVVAALEQIPASAVDDASSTVQFFAADLVAAAEQAGLTPPTDPSDSDQLLEFIGPLTGLASDGAPLRLFVPYPAVFVDRAVVQIEDFEAEVGFSPGSVTSFAALESPPARFIVASGVSLAANLPEVVPGVRTIGEGEDFETVLEARSTARPLGRPLRVAERDGRVALSLATVPVIDWISGPVAGTLADDPLLAAMATRLDEQDVVSAALVLFDDAPYLGVGLGWAADDAGPRGTIVFAYPTDAIAREQLEPVESSFRGDSLVTRTPVAELLTLGSIEVRGSEIVADIRFPDAGFPSRSWQMLLQRDGPFGAHADN